MNLDHYVNWLRRKNLTSIKFDFIHIRINETMSATITLARLVSTGRTVHIKDVDKKQVERYMCFDCKNELLPVKGIAEKKAIHFRHLVDTSCSGGRDTALHDYAVQILFENDSISLTKALHIQYSEPLKRKFASLRNVLM